jgi:hypothetical protein
MNQFNCLAYDLISCTAPSSTAKICRYHRTCRDDRTSYFQSLLVFHTLILTTNIQVIIANHLYRAKHPRISVILHCFNWCQIFRLLSTRGHYSIDLIIGYVVAVFVSNPAERLGLYYSRGTLQPSSLPGVAETFEILIGVSVSEVVGQHVVDDDVGPHNLDKEEKKTETTHSANKSRCIDTHTVQSETSVKIVMEIVADIFVCPVSA